MPFVDDAFEPPLDLNERLIAHPATTFFMRRAGETLIVDRAIDPRPGDTVVAVVDGELKLAKFEPGRPVELWGVVTYAIRDLRTR